MSLDRDRLQNTVAYLRDVRPIDPEEIHEYFDDPPHPAVVRQELRAASFDWRLRERDSGVFEPVAETPVSAPGWEPTRYPERYDRALADALVDRYGPDWPAGDSGFQLREHIRELKENYYRGQQVAYDTERALAYAIYHNPDTYATMGYTLESLAERGLLDRALRVLDVGAGAGGPAAAIAEFLPDDAVVEYHAVEPSANADIFERVIAETNRNVRASIHRETAESFDPASVGAVDLLLFNNVLSELPDPAETVERYLPAVADDGTCVLLAPADLETATTLRAVERTVVTPSSASDIFEPTLRLWPDTQPGDRGWSFDERSELDVPATQRRLADAADPEEFPDRRVEPDAFRNTSVRFAYAVVRPDGTRRTPVRADPNRHARLENAERHVTNRIDLLAVKLSHDLADDGNPVFRVGDGSQQTDQYAVLTRESSLNESLRAAEYGAVLAFENALVLWNDDEEAYNLVCDGECVVDPVA